MVGRGLAAMAHQAETKSDAVRSCASVPMVCSAPPFGALGFQKPVSVEPLVQKMVAMP